MKTAASFMNDAAVLAGRAAVRGASKEKRIGMRPDVVRLVQLDSAGVELVITAMFFEQIVMAATLNNFALFKHHDGV